MSCKKSVLQESRFEDMTEFENEYKQIKKKCEELERSNKEKEQLITKMSKDCKQIRDNFQKMSSRISWFTKNILLMSKNALGAEQTVAELARLRQVITNKQQLILEKSEIAAARQIVIEEMEQARKKADLARQQIQQEVAGLTYQNLKLKGDLQVLGGQKEKLIQSVQKYESKIVEKSAAIQQWKKAFKQQSELMAQRVKELERVRQENKKLKEQLQRSRHNNAAENL